MARQRNPRRIILEDLRKLNRWFRWATGQFDGGRTIYDLEARILRERTPAEYIENNPTDLREFANGARKVAQVLLDIAEFAESTAEVAEAKAQTAEETS